MKKLDFSKLEKPEMARPLMIQVTESSPQKPLTVKQIRGRVRVQTEIEKMTDDNLVMYLEDKDHEVLQEAMTSFPWAVANRYVLEVIDVIEKAPTFKPPIEEKPTESEIEAKSSA